MTIRRAARGFRRIPLGELWARRELIYFFVWRDLKVRYKQTALGVAWAVLQPLFTMLVFSLFFGRLAKMPSDGVPFTIFTFAALVPWTFFSNAVTQSSQSLVASANLLKKVYFPRLIIPLSAVLTGAVDLVLTLAVLGLLMIRYRIAPTAHLLLLPGALALAVIAANGVGLWLTALNVRFRDVRYVVPFLVQGWLFVTPIAYPSSIVPRKWLTLYALNPMVGVVDCMRFGLFGVGVSPGRTFLISTASALVILVSGALYFTQVEKTFADVA